MSIRARSTSYATIWEIDDKETYAVVKFGTSRKDGKTGEYVNSNWAFVRFVGEAYKKVAKLSERARITDIQMSIDNESYVDKNGNKQFPKSPRFTVWDFEMAEGAKPKSKPPVEYGDDTDVDLPFEM